MDNNQSSFDFEAVFQVDDYLYFYGDMLNEERTEVEVAALVRLLELDRPMQILDLACGFGRHTNRLAALGHRMTGVDLMPGFLEIARQDAQRRSVQVNYQPGDMRQIQYQAEFDRVLLAFTAFGYFEDEENLLVLQNVRRALKPGGLVIFDTQNRDTFLKGFVPCFVNEKEGNLMIDRITFDTQTGRLYNRRIVIRDGVRRDKPFFVRMYNPTEIRAVVAEAGLEITKLLGDWEGNLVSAESRRMIVIARKP